MALSDELIAIRLELKGQREAISGLHSVDKAQKGIGTSTAAAGTAAEKAEKKTSRLSRAYASLGKAAKWSIGILGVTGVLALHTAIENTEELSKTTVGLTRNFGMQTNVASRWAAVAHARDIDSKALSMSFSTLSSRMVEAGRKGGTALTPFHQMGLTQEEVAKGAHNFEWGLMRVVSALGDMEGGAKRTTAAKAAFGKGFQTIVPLMSEGTKGLKEQLHWADKYGVTLDGKTNSSIMDMVTAQRESKVATLGLQLALTKALMPAIEGGQHELQKFIATLNDPELTDDQKFHRIEQQFLGIEDTLIDIVTAALPKIAEHGGELGAKLAVAVWHGFWESDTLGKFVIAGWLFMAMGGGGLIRTVGGKAGAWVLAGMVTGMGNRFPILTIMFQDAFAGMGKLAGRAFAVGVVAGIVLLGFFIAEEIDKKTGGAFRRWGINAGQNFVNALIWVINKAIGLINSTLDKANVLSALGVDAPNIGEIGGVNWEAPDRPKGKFGLPSVDPRHPENPFGIDPKHPKSAGPRQPRIRTEAPRLPRINFGSFVGGNREIVLHTHVHLDGKEIAESTAHHVAAAEALA
jgi:hypothetical protein